MVWIICSNLHRGFWQISFWSLCSEWRRWWCWTFFRHINTLWQWWYGMPLSDNGRNIVVLLMRQKRRSFLGCCRTDTKVYYTLWQTSTFLLFVYFAMSRIIIAHFCCPLTTVWRSLNMVSRESNHILAPLSQEVLSFLPHWALLLFKSHWFGGEKTGLDLFSWNHFTKFFA